MFGHTNREEERRQAAPGRNKGKGSLFLPPHSAPPASSHSGVMKASTHTFHSAFQVQSVRVWPLSLWSSPKSTPVLCRSSYEVAQTFLTSGHTRAKSSPNIYGFCPQATPRGVWVMGYCGCMGYEVFFPANQLGGVKNLWDLWEYVVCEPWVTTYERVHCMKNRNRSAVRRTVECIRLFPSK